MAEAKKGKETEDKSVIKDQNNKKTCFIIMPIADHPDYPAGHFQRVYDYLIKPACDIAGLEPYRADDNKASDMIMLDILQKLVECDMAICDISSRNANVFFELGLRQAFNKKTILITDGLQSAPFDISGLRHSLYSHSLRVDTVAKEVPAIASMLNETEKLPENKVNSIVNLLQIKPAKIDSVDLNKEDSVIYGMLLNLQKQISELNKNQKKSSGLSIFRSEYDNDLSNDRNSFSGLSLITLMQTFPDQVFKQNYFFDDNEVGIIHEIRNDKISFNYKGHITSFSREPKILERIKAG
ncbi:hypothetical protein [Atlantibacter hermannii]|uniref:hypothetical protein n=1 Tax=Atlantibacter hermannii TaxID=565 RepID=UPI0028A7C6BD|nr:hypothetical protein [Atlantibacter hermannii]